MWRDEWLHDKVHCYITTLMDVYLGASWTGYKRLGCSLWEHSSRSLRLSFAAAFLSGGMGNCTKSTVEYGSQPQRSIGSIDELTSSDACWQMLAVSFRTRPDMMAGHFFLPCSGNWELTTTFGTCHWSAPVDEIRVPTIWEHQNGSIRYWDIRGRVQFFSILCAWSCRNGYWWMQLNQKDHGKQWKTWFNLQFFELYI